MKNILRFAIVAAAAFSTVAFAQDDDDFFGGDDAAPAGEAQAEEEAGDEEAEGGADGESGKSKAAKPSGKIFSLLPYCRRIEGTVEVLKPASLEWEVAIENKFYPLGSCFKTSGDGDYLRLQFGNDAHVIIQGKASFGTVPQPMGEQVRAITLLQGEVDVKLASNFPAGAFLVTTKGFSAKNLAGDSHYVYEKTPDGDMTTIRCVTGTLDVEGRHFAAQHLKAANEIKIRMANEALFTAIYGVSGDVNLVLDQGQVKEKDYESGESKIVDKTLEWKLSPLTAVRIHRAVPDIGQRMAVTVMTFNASGNLVNRCAFTEGLYEVNSGELCVSKTKMSDELAKKASEASETEDSDVEEEDSGDEEDGGDGEESGDEGGGEDSGDSGGGDDDFEF